MCVSHPTLWQQISSHLIAWFVAKFALICTTASEATCYNTALYKPKCIPASNRKKNYKLAGKDEKSVVMTAYMQHGKWRRWTEFSPVLWRRVQEGWLYVAGLLQLPANFPQPKLKWKGFQHKKNIYGKWGLVSDIYLAWEPWSITVNSQSFPGLFIKWLHSTGISNVSSQQHSNLLRCGTGTSTAAQLLGSTKCDRLAILALRRAREEHVNMTVMRI